MADTAELFQCGRETGARREQPTRSVSVSASRGQPAAKPRLLGTECQECRLVALAGPGWLLVFASCPPGPATVQVLQEHSALLLSKLPQGTVTHRPPKQPGERARGRPVRVWVFLETYCHVHTNSKPSLFPEIVPRMALAMQRHDLTAMLALAHFSDTWPRDLKPPKQQPHRRAPRLTLQPPGLHAHPRRPRTF